jgi:hypothetical protein
MELRLHPKIESHRGDDLKAPITVALSYPSICMQCLDIKF